MTEQLKPPIHDPEHYPEDAIPEFQLYEMGQRFIDFGTALQNQESTINELAKLAYECGYTLKFNISFIDHKNEPDDGKCWSDL